MTGAYDRRHLEHLPGDPPDALGRSGFLDASQTGNGRRLVDAQELADVLGVSRDYVYRHASELGAIPLGSGPKARIRFDVEATLERLTSYAGKGSAPPECACAKALRKPRARRSEPVPNPVPAIRLVAKGSRAA